MMFFHIHMRTKLLAFEINAAIITPAQRSSDQQHYTTTQFRKHHLIYSFSSLLERRGDKVVLEGRARVDALLVVEHQHLLQQVLELQQLALLHICELLVVRRQNAHEIPPGEHGDVSDLLLCVGGCKKEK